jgi:hypothetical protein
MGYPYPKAPLEDGTGTTPLDLQRIIGAQYVASGLLPNGGGTVSGTSSMSYAVTAGVAFMWTSSAARLGMLVPFEAVTVPTDPAPATGSRTDTVYVDGDGAVRVAIGSASVPGGVPIARFTVPAGITATSAASQSIDRAFAIGTGASLGRMHSFHDPANGNWGNVSPMQLGRGRFTLPSDRLVDVRMTWTASAEPDGADYRTWGVARWFVHVTGATTTSFATNWHYQGVHPRTEHLSITLNLNEGDHEVWYVQERMGGARFRHHKGGPDGWLGNRFEVWDGGAAR